MYFPIPKPKSCFNQVGFAHSAVLDFFLKVTLFFELMKTPRRQLPTLYPIPISNIKRVGVLSEVVTLF